MRGCAFSVVLWMAGSAVASAAMVALLHYQFGFAWADCLVPGAVAGSLLWIALGLLRGALQSQSERSWPPPASPEPRRPTAKRRSWSAASSRWAKP